MWPEWRMRKREEGAAMKRIDIKLIGVLAFMICLVPTAYANETKGMASASGSDPIALLLVEQGEKLLNENQREGALASFELAMEVDPALSNAYLQASAVASQLGDSAKAAAYLEALRRRKPNDLQVQRTLADLKTAKGRPDPAGFASSGFIEFGLAALLGWGFYLFIAGYEVSQTPPQRRATALQVDKPYLLYPLLKIFGQETEKSLLAIHEKRHRHHGLHAAA
jgi:tetratricopeptide (TPR) repeat protein